MAWREPGEGWGRLFGGERERAQAHEEQVWKEEVCAAKGVEHVWDEMEHARDERVDARMEEAEGPTKG
jgi:hypothetical protein